MTNPTKKRLYRLTIPRDSLGDESSTSSRNISSQGTLTTGVSTVEDISVQPGGKSLSGQYRGQGADRLAHQVKELFDAGDIEAVAYFQQANPTQDDGYYNLSNGDTSRPDAKQNAFVRFSGNMTKIGTRQSHYRKIDIKTENVTNTFFDTFTSTVGVPADATRIFWYNSVSGSQTSATPASTVEQESVYDLSETSPVTRDVHLFDAETAPYDDDSVLVYDLPYDEEGRTDCGVWDTRDSPDGNKITVTNGEPVLNWQRVFVQDHDFRGNPVFENGRFHIEFDTTNNTILAEEWNSGTQSWDTISLGASNGWGPIDVDFTELDEACVRAQVTFEDSDNGDIYSFDFVLGRGKDRPQILQPRLSQIPPTDLETYLQPLADEEELDPNVRQGLIQRSEVRM